GRSLQPGGDRRLVIRDRGIHDRDARQGIVHHQASTARGGLVVADREVGERSVEVVHEDTATAGTSLIRAEGAVDQRHAFAYAVIETAPEATAVASRDVGVDGA